MFGKVTNSFFSALHSFPPPLPKQSVPISQSNLLKDLIDLAPHCFNPFQRWNPFSFPVFVDRGGFSSSSSPTFALSPTVRKRAEAVLGLVSDADKLSKDITELAEFSSLWVDTESLFLSRSALHPYSFGADLSFPAVVTSIAKDSFVLRFVCGIGDKETFRNIAPQVLHRIGVSSCRCSIEIAQVFSQD